ncbi:MAG: hypothetical protein ACT4P4_18785 [Betaproteobacteria bacterium]
MIPPDREIYEVEERIARRRHNLEFVAKDSARRAFVALTSPGALVGAAVLGFLAGGGIGKKKVRYVERRRSDEKAKAAKATGIAGVLMSGAMFLVKQQFGSPLGLARFILQKVQGQRTAHQRVERPFA